MRPTSCLNFSGVPKAMLNLSIEKLFFNDEEVHAIVGEGHS
jgi:hypothetical protein